MRLIVVEKLSFAETGRRLSHDSGRVSRLDRAGKGLTAPQAAWHTAKADEGGNTHGSKMRRGSVRHLGVLAFLLVLSVAPTVRDCTARKDSLTRRVRVLYLGDPIGPSPFPFMLDEPLLSATPVMACKMWYSYKMIRRNMRIYMPRTFEALNDSYDLVILSDASVKSFETRHLHWFSSIVTDEGAGLVMVGGFESFGGNGYTPWGPTSVGEILPVGDLPWRNAEGQIVIVKPDSPVVSNLPWNTLGDANYLGGNPVTQKPGSVLVANTRSALGETNPLWVWWDSGRGRSFAMAADWTPAGGTAFMKWAYYGDFAINVVLFTCSERVPEDIEMVHSVRRILRQYSETRSYLYSMMDFAEKFGANMRPVEKRIAEANEESEQARRLYLLYEFDDAASSAGEAVGIIEKALDEAIDAKDRALIWVFLIEWMVVLSTCMISGALLYTLMVKRRLYRAVEVTRPKKKRRISL